MRRRRDARILGALLFFALVSAPLAAADGDVDLGWGVQGVAGPENDLEVVGAGRSHYAGGTALVGNDLQGTDDSFQFYHFDATGDDLDLCAAAFVPYEDFVGHATTYRGGKTYLGGSVDTTGNDRQRAIVVRMDSGSCEVDAGFGSLGSRLLGATDLCAGADCRVVDIAINGSNQIFALVERLLPPLISDYFVYALSPSGDIYTLFGDSGHAQVAGAGIGVLFNGSGLLEVDPQGRPIVFASRFDPDVSLDLDVILVRFTQDGELDPTFDGDGWREFNASNVNDAFAVAFALHGRWLAFVFRQTGSSEFPSITGIWRTDLSEGNSLFSGNPYNSAVWERNGKLLLGAVQPAGFLAALRFRVLPGPDFEFDPAFGTNGGANATIPGASATTLVDVVLQPGAIDLVGQTTVSGTEGVFVVRLENALLFADDFESGARDAWSN
jgi:hypothetical protein